MQRPLVLLATVAVALLSFWNTAPGAMAEQATPTPPARKIVIVGATARSSEELIWQALALGYEVIGVARDPAKVELRHERLRVLRGDVYDRDSLAAALDGDEIVISMVGPRVDPTQEVKSMDLFTVGTRNLIAAMKQKGNKRLLVASSLGVENQKNVPAQKPPASDPSTMWLWNSRLLYADMLAMEDLVRNSGLEYVIFRPGFLLEEPPRRDVKLSVDTVSPKGRLLSFADFASFVMDQVASSQYLGRTVGMYSDRELKFGANADFAKLSAGMAERAAGQTPQVSNNYRGNAARGRAISETCVPCHGETGISPSPAFPHIAGQQFDYLVSAMLAYLSNTRQDSIMGGAIRTLSRVDIEDLAAFYAVQRGPGAAASTETAAGGAPNATANAPAPGASAAGSGGALAAALAQAQAARSLAAVVPRRGSSTGDARELKACAEAPQGLPQGFAIDADGDGYLGVCNVAQLRALSQPMVGGDPNAPNKRHALNFELVADLDLTGVVGIEPIGNCGLANNCMISRDRYGFAGHFDGNGHTIRGLKIDKPETGGVGLFGTLARSGVVSRFKLREAFVRGANGAGLLVGANFGRIADCDVQGRVEGKVAIGGVTGGNAGRIEGIRARVAVQAVAAAGGLVGDMNGTLSDSRAEVYVRASGKGVGGLVGLSTFGTIERLAVVGSVAGSDNVGGAVGVNTDALLAEVTAQVDVNASATNAGGLIGYNSQSVLRDSFARGTVRGANAVGGLVGRNLGAVINAYSTGKVSGSGKLGGLIGDNAGGTVLNAFFDAESAGTDAGPGLALKTVELTKLPAAQARWDEAVWAFDTRGLRTPQLRRLSADFGPSADAAGPLVNTLRRFTAGDVFVAATVMNDPKDDHAGAGRILQYDADLNFKGELWLSGTTHKVGGLSFGPDKTLWAMAQLTPAVVEIGRDGRQKRYKVWSERKLSSVVFAPDGSLLFGEHMAGTQTGHPSITTKFKLLNGRNTIGDGHVFRFSRDGQLLKEYRTANNGGMFGFLAVTSMVLADSGRRLIYLSETGKLVQQYDLANDRQLPELANFSGNPAMPMVLVMNPLPDGRLLISNGGGFAIVSPKDGAVERSYRLDGLGWAAVNSSSDGEHAFVGNFWTGELVKVRLSDGAVEARAFVGQRESLSGVAQFPG